MCLDQLIDYGFDSGEDSGDEDFGSMLFITLLVYLSGLSWKLKTLCNVSTLWEVFVFFTEISVFSVWNYILKDQAHQKILTSMGLVCIHVGNWKLLLYFSAF